MADIKDKKVKRPDTPLAKTPTVKAVFVNEEGNLILNARKRRERLHETGTTPSSTGKGSGGGRGIVD